MAKTTTLSRPRHNQHVRQQAERVVGRMQDRGLALHAELRWYGRHFFMSNGERLDTEVAAAVIRDPRVVDVGDARLPGVAGQTWRVIGRGEG